MRQKFESFCWWLGLKLLKIERGPFKYDSSHENSCMEATCQPLYYLRRVDEKNGQIQEARIIETGVQEHLHLLWKVAEMQGMVDKWFKGRDYRGGSNSG